MGCEPRRSKYALSFSEFSFPFLSHLVTVEIWLSQKATPTGGLIFISGGFIRAKSERKEAEIIDIYLTSVMVYQMVIFYHLHLKRVFVSTESKLRDHGGVETI